MKKTFSFILIISIFITLGIFSGCSNNSDEAKAEKVISEYVNTFYTIYENDLENYKIITSGSDVNDKNKYEKFTEALNKSNEKFKPLMTNEAYQNLVAVRMSYSRVSQAFKNKYYCKVKNIKIEKYSEDKSKNMLVYYYDIEILQTSIKDSKENIVKERQQISVVSENSAWKVSQVNY